MVSDTVGTATYSPDDNKLRLYPFARLDAETYARVKTAGFAWAPKQELFVAGMWTPSREDLLTELCGEIGDEDATLTDRAEERAERFETYSEKRLSEAERARQAVDQVAQRFEGGQPILVGHHSERRARKDQERIHNGMRKAVQLWSTSNYWTDRAAGAIRHAKYKERPDVRARRIKTIEAERRKCERNIEQCRNAIEVWETLETSPVVAKLIISRREKTISEAAAEALTLESASFLDRAIFICGNTRHGGRFENYSDLREGKKTPEEVRDGIIAGSQRLIAFNERWIAHFDLRLSYERAMLAASGYQEPPKPKTSAALPLLNYAGPVSYRNPYSGEVVTRDAIGITKAQLAAIGDDYKGTRVSACVTHRVRTAMHVPGQDRHGLFAVYLTDSKQHARPDAATVEAKAAEEAAARDQRMEAKRLKEEARLERIEATREEREARERDAAPFKALKDTLQGGGVQVVVAPQLFVTPPELAARVAEEADIRPGMCVLEPSAGTGNLLAALPNVRPDGTVTAVEINSTLAHALREVVDTVRCADFLDLTPADLGTFDRIVMNPPFENASDVRHIEHALTFLKPGGRLVAICAAGPRQRAKLQPIAEESGGYWEDLPAGTFKSSGTNVNTALVVIEAVPADASNEVKKSEELPALPVAPRCGAPQLSLF